eukprot:CAMPEP_0172417560 /NCGR_PEP_ID=MMETSP1064-20121228/4090_1 /TAXON_ID=202472 /ORGANISM="Aulacoseira subarctica , Strain CCAP 1002/5" /LENGTH=398 /DNA_ID=CAMNT_0013155987 /DNA_START=113 /DNA_END=1309 /DNA_ORIENTATION=+
MIGLNLVHRIAGNSKSSNIQTKEDGDYTISSLYQYGEDSATGFHNHDGGRMDIHQPQLISARPQEMSINDGRLEQVLYSQPGIPSTDNAALHIVPAAPDFIQETAALHEGERPDHNADNLAEDQNQIHDDSVMKSGIIQIQLGADGEVEETIDMPYYHCGPFYILGANQGNYFGEETNDNKPVEETKIYHEFLFLHGAAYTKEDWKTSGILDKMCSRSPEDVQSHTHYSVTAVDLNVKSDGLMLAKAFEALAEGGIISGLPIIIVSPSASGRGVLDLAEISQQSEEASSEEASSEEATHISKYALNLLQATLMAWVPVACYDVNNAKDILFGTFESSHIPILAIHGSSDIRGKEVADRLEKVAGARKLVVGKNHACYLDEPDRFVAAVKSIIKPRNDV